jgi:hypothetical protein
LSSTSTPVWGLKSSWSTKRSASTDPDAAILLGAGLPTNGAKHWRYLEINPPVVRQTLTAEGIPEEARRLGEEGLSAQEIVKRLAAR